MCDEQGQSTVEAAFIIPVLFITVLMLLQPGILLYDRTVMQHAAAQGCRVLIAKTSITGMDSEAYERSIRRHLGAIPPIDVFHVRDQEHSWDIALEGDEMSPHVQVTIRNQVKPLPLFDAGSALLGLTNSNGNLEQEVTVSMDTHASWVVAEGISPDSWVRAER